MSYGDDFATVDTAGAPLDPVIMIGADSFFWGAVLLALLVAALIGWWFAGGSRPRRVDAAGPIWEAIDDAAKLAMHADSEALPARAGELRRVLKARLGKTLAFGGELSGCVGALDRALNGEVDHGAGHAAPDHPAEEPGPEADHEAGEPVRPSSSAAANVTIVSIHPGAGGPSRRPSRQHGGRAMTTRERNEALRLAVSDFNDYWRHRAAREGDMRAVVAELCNPGPRRPRLSHSSDHH
ncbi:hypothetical protein [Brevundimonas sp.]|uniref:hypothetical protein n=1 Tax=Brevundimonas sp. TaxID=1871086 RepID=UPI002D5EE21F|nr:hypothetical protein [Brevundimonas sp.]HYC67336.1 hypothetical protein [Brevundimonas sp.]